MEMTAVQLQDRILEDLAAIAGGEQGRRETLPYRDRLQHPNELLCFLKPEITSLDERHARAVLDLLLAKLDEYAVEITGGLVVRGDYLDRHDLMAQHYGVINEVARRGAGALAAAARTRFQEAYGRPVEDAEVLGALEFLRAFPEVSGEELDRLWERSSVVKLAGGTYCAKVTAGGREVYLLNGFHPAQLTYFTRRSASIVVLSLQTGAAWRGLREDMLGATDPAKAKSGSLRRILLEERQRYGLAEVNQGLNCAHLSAGPLEAIGEVARFMSDYDGRVLRPEETALGRWFVEQGVAAERLVDLLRNPRIDRGGSAEPVFDATELMDAGPCLALLKEPAAGE
jgi:hypothetical protein